MLRIGKQRAEGQAHGRNHKRQEGDAAEQRAAPCGGGMQNAQCGGAYQRDAGKTQGVAHRCPSVAVGQDAPRAAGLHCLPCNRGQWQGAAAEQQGGGEGEQGVLVQAAWGFGCDGPPFRCFGLPPKPCVQYARAGGDGEHQPNQHGGVFHVQFISNELVDFHFDGGVLPPAQQQRQPEAGKAVEENQAACTRQPRPQHGQFHMPELPPCVRAQCLRRGHAVGGYGEESLVGRTHRHGQVEKQIAVQQKRGCVLPAAPQQPVFAEQSQHAHARHQRGHDERQHQ